MDFVRLNREIVPVSLVADKAPYKTNLACAIETAHIPLARWSEHMRGVSEARRQRARQLADKRAADQDAGRARQRKRAHQDNIHIQRAHEIYESDCAVRGGLASLPQMERSRLWEGARLRAETEQIGRTKRVRRQRDFFF